MTTSKEKNVFYVHYYESDSSGGELPLMRIEAENEDEANLICLRNLADVYDVDHDDISLEDGFEVNGNSVYLQGIYPATAEQALVVDAVFNMTSVEPVAEAVTGTAESACGISLVSDKVWLESWFDLEDKFADQMAHVAEDDKSDTRFLLYRDQVIDVRECETSSVPGWDLQFGLSGGTQMLFIRLSDDGDHVALGLE
ncbi:hypothetical protein NTB97_003035 [Salmonella enterica]|jgi:hypothetical protein|uniref:hypothetical protein n=1 Tax=Citrobacter portucalensis TaxID=1639133 RepID=UPI002A5666F3|nr:hypothetical protein [Citrobacter portucalensis]EBD9299173.1 hypothetical protein [Salmonella enterica]EDZ1686128.1 hypothetical protein [Salmonella enterica]EEB5060147.1 hypothetical protein [Salmonella enterica]EKK4450451.1 hypothetical protein [Salmonella enterica]MEB1114814.1 hypothetical protein [Citrobacter portucalensis]